MKQVDIMKWQAVFFDFDGVILDSVDVKTKAFAQMFRQYGPEIEEAVVRYHLENGGMSRYEKFRYFYEHLLQQYLTEEKLDELGRQFSELVVQKVLESPFVQGALDTLKVLKKHKISAFVVSGTPEEEIKFIVKKKGLEKYFEEVHGSPKKKQKIVAEIVEKKLLIPNKCIFLGDAYSDYKAAQLNNICFLGIVPENAPLIFPENTKTATKICL